MVAWHILASVFALATAAGAEQRAGVISKDGENETSLTLKSNEIEQLMRRASDPADFGWVKRWSAIGDSFTAGIGSGRVVVGPVKKGKSHSKCSRYDLSYPMLVSKALGPGVDKFDFVACSGDRSGAIYDQALFLEPEQDLVMMTAGGNDLCLVRLSLRFPLKPSPC